MHKNVFSSQFRWYNAAKNRIAQRKWVSVQEISLDFFIFL